MSQILVIAKIKGKKGMHFPEEVIIEPQETGISGIYVARVLSKTFTATEIETSREIKVAGANLKITGSNHSRVMVVNQENPNIENNVWYCHVKMLNSSKEPVQLGKNVIIGTAENLHEGISEFEELRSSDRINVIGKKKNAKDSGRRRLSVVFLCTGGTCVPFV
jgi:hypothetical protein